MHIVAVAWLFVVVLMAAATAMSGSPFTALGMLIFYGALPLGVVLYIIGAPARRRARDRREAAEAAQAVQRAAARAEPEATSAGASAAHDGSSS